MELGKKIEDTQEVFICVYLRSGDKIYERTLATGARETIEAWKKYCKFFMLSPEERSKTVKEEWPWSIYYFLDGRPQTEDEPLPVKTMFLMQDVIAMQYTPVPPDEPNYQKEAFKSQTKMMKAFEEFLKSESGADWWKEHNCDHDKEEGKE